MANQTLRYNPLLPWWIGLAIIVAAVAYVAYRFSCPECGSIGGLLEGLLLAVIPADLTLMYLTFKSEAESER